MKEVLAQFFSLFLFVLFFVLVSYFTQQNLTLIESFLSRSSSFFGMFLYLFFAFFATVFAPVSSIPLVPLASKLWGWQMTAFLSVLGWWIGSLVAFYIARKFGRPVVEKIISMKKLEKFENKIPKDNLFVYLVFLRMVMPVDILSYALGLFSKVSFFVYSLATLIGIIPFAILFAYAGSLDLKEQLLVLLLALSVFALFFLLKKNVILLKSK